MKVTLNTKIEKKPDIGKLVKRRFNKKDFVEMMALANKYPLSVRIAAELFRGNVTGKRFLDEFHIEGNSFSMQILDSITKFDLKKGYDPKGIPPVLPVYTQYVGPTQAKTYYHDDLVVCLLRGGFTRVEQTLLDGGRGHAVIAQRMEFQEVMRERFTAVIEHATGRPVIGFMSGNQQNPDMICEVFVLSPSDLVEPHELGLPPQS